MGVAGLILTLMMFVIFLVLLEFAWSKAYSGKDDDAEV